MLARASWHWRGRAAFRKGSFRGPLLSIAAESRKARPETARPTPAGPAGEWLLPSLSHGSVHRPALVRPLAKERDDGRSAARACPARIAQGPRAHAEERAHARGAGRGRGRLRRELHTLH